MIGDDQGARDLVVLVPGIMGSTLVDHRGRVVWGLGRGGLVRALRTFGRSAKRLTLPDDVGDGPAPDGVTATTLLDRLHVIPGLWSPVGGYGPLMAFLLDLGLVPVADPGDPDAPAGNLLTCTYDWRLSHRHNAGVLRARVEPALERWRASAPERADARLVIIGSSTGGLVARWYLDRLGGADHTRALVTLGTPHRGATRTVVQVVNGLRAGPRALRADLDAFAASLPATYELLAEHTCIENPVSGARHRLVKAGDVALPNLDPLRAKHAAAFHRELGAASRDTDGCYVVVNIVGTDQPTITTCRLDGERLVPLPTINGNDLGGDGAVPRIAARPKHIPESDPRVHALAEGHGSLNAHPAVHDRIELLLTGHEHIFRRTRAREVPSLGSAEVFTAGDAVTIDVGFPHPRPLEVACRDERGREVAGAPVRSGRARFDGLAPGGYTAVVRAADDPTGADLAPVHHSFVVLENER